MIIYYLTLLARVQLAKINPKVIGLTGSVGKTTLRDLISTVLSQKYIVRCAQQSMNSDIGVPMAVFNIKPSKDYIQYLFSLLIIPIIKLITDWKKYDFFIIEKGIEEPGDMDYLGLLTKLDVAILLNVYPVHTANFPTNDPLYSLYQEKFKIFSHLKENGIGIINGDNIYIGKYLESSSITKSISRLSSTLTECEIPFKCTMSEKGNMEVQIGTCNYTCDLKVPIEYACSIALSVYIGTLYNISCVEIQQGLNIYKSEPGRFGFFQGLRGSMLLDSTYNSSPHALESTLKYVRTQSDFKRKILCLGDMRELGILSEKEHMQLAPLISSTGDLVFLVGEQMCKFVHPRLDIPVENKKCFRNSLLLGDYLKTVVQSGDLIVFKGSQNTVFLEEALKMILADPKDISNLCRQDKFWINKKKRFFEVANLT